MLDPDAPSQHGDPGFGAAERRDGYVSAQLQSARAGSSYDRERYARKAWTTFGGSMPADRSARVLDIGPGECEFAELLISSFGYDNVEVLDMADDVVAIARERGITATQADDTAGWLDGQTGSIDTVVLLHVLEHVPKPEIIRLLSSIRRSLRYDGRLLLEVPNMGDPLNGLYFRYSDFTHEVGFTEESLNYVLRQAGFGQIRYLAQAGAHRRAVRAAQRLSRATLHGMLYVVNLPNGRQMRRRIGPVLSVCATP